MSSKYLCCPSCRYFITVADRANLQSIECANQLISWHCRCCQKIVQIHYNKNLTFINTNLTFQNYRHENESSLQKVLYYQIFLHSQSSKYQAQLYYVPLMKQMMIKNHSHLSHLQKLSDLSKKSQLIKSYLRLKKSYHKFWLFTQIQKVVSEREYEIYLIELYIKSVINQQADRAKSIQFHFNINFQSNYYYFQYKYPSQTLTSSLQSLLHITYLLEYPKSPIFIRNIIFNRMVLSNRRQRTSQQVEEFLFFGSYFVNDSDPNICNKTIDSNIRQKNNNSKIKIIYHFNHPEEQKNTSYFDLNPLNQDKSFKSFCNQQQRQKQAYLYVFYAISNSIYRYDFKLKKSIIEIKQYFNEHLHQIQKCETSFLNLILKIMCLEGLNLNNTARIKIIKLYGNFHKEKTTTVFYVFGWKQIEKDILFDKLDEDFNQMPYFQFWQKNKIKRSPFGKKQFIYQTKNQEYDEQEYDIL